MRVIAELSERERDVLRAMASGQSNAAISRELHISPKTTECHVRRIFIKLCLQPRHGEHRRVAAVLAYLDATGSTPEISVAAKAA
jgi:DNA-binding NarL/FixJ family response regulator